MEYNWHAVHLYIYSYITGNVKKEVMYVYIHALVLAVHLRRISHLLWYSYRNLYIEVTQITDCDLLMKFSGRNIHNSSRYIIARRIPIHVPVYLNTHPACSYNTIISTIVI